tara:strand:- start:3093 stop:3419 length:327 start_codon:yes stop_codon:yes gene_type:complete
MGKTGFNQAGLKSQLIFVCYILPETPAAETEVFARRRFSGDAGLDHIQDASLSFLPPMPHFPEPNQKTIAGHAPPHGHRIALQVAQPASSGVQTFNRQIRSKARPRLW